MKHNLKTLWKKVNLQHVLDITLELQKVEEELQHYTFKKDKHLSSGEILLNEILGENQEQKETEYTSLEIPKDLKEALDKSVISPIDALWDAIQKEGENQHG